MTYRELLQKEHPERVDKKYMGGCFKCPCNYGYEADNAKGQPCLKHLSPPSNAICTACWDREIPGSESLESGGAQTGGLISRSALLADLRGQGFLPAIVQRAIDRLAAYEDIGPIDHLRELVQAEQDGKLVVLPCKVGDTVYMPDPAKNIIPVRVQGIAITASGQTILHFGGYPVEYAWGNEVGKTIHLTRAEAEPALEAQKGGDME